jgi:hypothetical protein
LFLNTHSQLHLLPTLAELIVTKLPKGPLAGLLFQWAESIFDYPAFFKMEKSRFAIEKVFKLLPPTPKYLSDVE